VAGVPDLHLAVVNPEVDRIVGPPLDDEGVEACELQLRPEPPSTVGVMHRPRQRGLGDGAPSTGGGDAADAGEGARQEEGLIRRAEGVNPRIDLPQQQVDAQPPAADPGPQHLLREGLVGDHTAPEVDSSDPAHVTPRHLPRIRLGDSLEKLYHLMNDVDVDDLQGLRPKRVEDHPLTRLQAQSPHGGGHHPMQRRLPTLF